MTVDLHILTFLKRINRDIIFHIFKNVIPRPRNSKKRKK